MVIYSCQRESCLGSRLTKHCHYCKLYEHYRYYSLNGTRQYDRDVLSLDLGSGICETPLLDRQILKAKALPHSILQFNAFNQSAKRLAPHLAEFFLSTVRRSFEFVAFKKFWQRTWN